MQPMEIRSFITFFPGKDLFKNLVTTIISVNRKGRKIIFYAASANNFECYFIKDFTPLFGFTYRIAGAEKIHKKAIAVNTFLKKFTIISNVVLTIKGAIILERVYKL